ncbi:19019_t:CDS:2 [Racocetra persica]|uniref:19019_t:CDS:1 n=1 Tax=Racocetra persica TaxID=160502 RepID=A0ACA9KK15_9GLOM|nr:19019_t:CDS:2 [Racocetra persica]
MMILLVNRQKKYILKIQEQQSGESSNILINTEALSNILLDNEVPNNILLDIGVQTQEDEDILRSKYIGHSVIVLAFICLYYRLLQLSEEQF